MSKELFERAHRLARLVELVLEDAAVVEAYPFHVLPAETPAGE